jgi:hypothetical protein
MGSWVSSIEQEDIIELVARAEYPAWVNLVKSAEIEIFFEVETTEQSAPLEINRHVLEYKNLSRANDIRVIQLHPGLPDDVLKCRLVHLSLEDAQTAGFEAVSYCWGRASEQVTLSLEYEGNDNEFLISASVERLLKHLRREDGQIRTLWLDAICINQSDPMERAQQVSLMGTLYSVATTVNIWLGSTDPTIRLAFQVIRDLHNFKAKRCPGSPKCKCSGTGHTMTHEQFRQAELGEPRFHDQLERVAQWHIARKGVEARYSGQASHKSLLSEIFRNPWFRRVWVLQEAVNSKHAIVQCGSDAMPWKELIEVSNYSASYMPHIASLVRLPLIWSTLGKIRNTVLPAPVHEHETRKSLERRADLGILPLVVEALELDASDPRDKLFALLTFGQETKDISNLPDLIRPNYSKRTREVFADFTRWWITKYNSLHILSMVHGNAGRSWQAMELHPQTPVSDTRPSWTIGTEGLQFWAEATLVKRFHFSASNNMSPEASLLIDDAKTHPLQLRLLGHEVARIQELSHFSVSGRRFDLELFKVYEEMFEPTVGAGRWKSVLKTHLDESGPAQMECMMHEHLQAHWAYEADEALSLLHARSEKTEGGSNFERVASTSAFPCHGRCFFVASDGSVGLCPATAKEGDHIVILLGGNVPFLLRKVNAEDLAPAFELVGECYVDGIMHGEYIKKRMSEGKTPEYFVLV